MEKTWENQWYIDHLDPLGWLQLVQSAAQNKEKQHHPMIHIPVPFAKHYNPYNKNAHHRCLLVRQSNIPNPHFSGCKMRTSFSCYQLFQHGERERERSEYQNPGDISWAHDYGRWKSSRTKHLQPRKRFRSACIWAWTLLDTGSQIITGLMIWTLDMCRIYGELRWV